MLDKVISGYAQQKQVAGDNNLLAVVIDVSRDVATIALSGEVAQAKVLEVPFSFVNQHARI